MATTVTASIPGSPPDLSASRSSKSSSYCSTFDSDGADTLATAFDTNFEDISLDDDGLDHIHHLHTHKQQPALLPPSLDSTPKAMTPAPVPSTLSPLHTQLRGAPKDADPALPVPKEPRTAPLTHARRGFTSPVNPFLATTATTTAASLTPRPRSSSPPKLGGRSASHSSAATLSTRNLRPDWSMSPASRPLALRARSYQASRRSVKELEAEYNDSDDDLTDDTSLWNVPISPAFDDQSRRPSFRGSPGRSPVATSPRPIPLQHPTPHYFEPHAQKSQRSPPSQRLPKRRRPPPLRSTSLNTAASKTATTATTNNNHNQFPPRRQRLASLPINHNPSPSGKERFALPGRTRSYNVALSELSEEARILSESLEYHAENQRLSQLESSSLQSRRDRSATLTPKPSLIQLPPIQRGNLDFMPISKEKEAILSRTRPSWLPPKDPKEEKRHLKEYKKMMAASLEAERKQQPQPQPQHQERQQKQRSDTEQSPDRIWQSYSAPSTADPTTPPDRRVFSLCWRGVSPNLRARVWQRAIGNGLRLDAGSFHNALARAKHLQAAASTQQQGGLRGRERSPVKAWFTDIERDAETAFPELGLFQRNGPLWQDLIDVCKAYACYRADVGYVYGLQLVAALILLQTSSPADAFILLANAMNQPAPLAFQSGDSATTTRIYNHAVDTLAIKFPRLHEYLFGSIECGGLGFTPAVIFEPMFKTLFCNGLDVERLCRVWDIWVFEGDKTLVRTAVAILGGCLQSQIFEVAGDIDLKRRNIQEMLAWGPFNRTCKGQHWQFPADMDENGFGEEIRLAGRLDYMGR